MSGRAGRNDYNLVLAADDLRDLEYIFSAVSWIEDGPVPDDFKLGLDESDKVSQPWAWAAGHHGWRTCPEGIPVMARTVHIKRTGGSFESQMIFEERHYGRRPPQPEDLPHIVPRWLPRVQLIPPTEPSPVPGGVAQPAGDPTTGPVQALALESERAMTDPRFQLTPDPRPDRNPMSSEYCLPVPDESRYLGPCGHPSCHRAADNIGMNRVCVSCAAEDRECRLFRCAACYEDVPQSPTPNRRED